MTDKARKDFEEWHRSVVEGEPPHEKYDSGDYLNQYVQRYWLGWQASRAALVIELPSTYGICDPEEYRDECRAVIDASGLKVKP